MVIKAGTMAVTGLLWQASSPSDEFRACKWTSTLLAPMFKGNENHFGAEIKQQPGVNRLMYGEIEFEQDGRKFLLTTQIYRYSSN